VTDPDVLARTRRTLGPVGVWLGSLARATVDEERDAARRIERWGYGSLWTGERIGGREAFAHQALLLAATERLLTGTGIANIWARHPATMQGGADTLAEAWPGRFLLGIGISHEVAVARSGQTYERPLERMRSYLDGMDAARDATPSTGPSAPRLLAALRPRMLTLARERTDGAHPYFVPPSHTPVARGILGADRLLIPEQAVVLERSPDEARRIARAHMEMYLQLPNYVNNLLALGFSDSDVSGGGSDRLVDAIVAWGDEAAIAARVREHLDGGADSVLLQPLGELGQALRQLEELAPAVL
jgi:probable F420-dependent oxidoreductase